MTQTPILTEEQRKRLDRQRFIGIQTQKRIFITPANGINTQLAKNLILSGVNVTLYDNAIINEDDYQTNFLIAKSDIGRKRGEAVFEKLKEMNPSGKNQWIDQNPIENPQNYSEEFFKTFTIIVTSQKSFDKIKFWDNLSKKINIPYYNQIGCGLYAFSYISLGTNYEYKQISKKDKSVSKIWNITSLNLDECLDPKNFTRAKESNFLSAIIMMANAEQAKISFNPFLQSQNYEQIQRNQQNLNKIIQIGVKLKEGFQKNRQFYKRFATCYGINYCPVYSVIGSIVSQEIIKIAENQSQPGINWLFYESEEGYGSVFKLKSQQAFMKSRNPNQIITE